MVSFGYRVWLPRNMTIPSHTNHTMRPSPKTAPSTSSTGTTVSMTDTPITMPR